jgi:CRISPR/Cas system CMR-associated protein Cmr5 small subunit
MKNIEEIEEACERAAKMQNKSDRYGSKYPSMTYEAGLRDALDWVMENADDDPTEG